MDDNNVGNANPSNGEEGGENPYENLEAGELRELLNTRDTDIEKEKKLKNDFYIRARKAEGYEPDPNNPDSWIKTVTKAEKKKESTPNSEGKQSGDIDYGQLAFFNQRSETKIEHEDDLQFLKDEMEKWGRSQSDLLLHKYFLTELKQRQDERVVKEATPSSPARSGTSAKDVSYWKNQPYEKVPTHMRNEVLDAIKEDQQKAQQGSA